MSGEKSDFEIAKLTGLTKRDVAKVRALINCDCDKDFPDRIWDLINRHDGSSECSAPIVHPTDPILTGFLTIDPDLVEPVKLVEPTTEEISDVEILDDLTEFLDSIESEEE